MSRGLADLQRLEVVFPDKGLETAVREALEKPDGPLARQELEGLEKLNARGLMIEDLTGLERCVNLTELWLTSNEISNITPLASLTNLTNLWLKNNQISDLTPLASLTNLTNLWLKNNQISDLTPLASLTKLIDLSLSDNQISDAARLTH